MIETKLKPVIYKQPSYLEDSIVDECFEFNSFEDMKIREFTVGNSKTPIVCIDNFYKYPMKIRALAFITNFTDDVNLTRGAPLIRSKTPIQIDFMDRYIHLFKKFFGEDSYRITGENLTTTELYGNANLLQVDDWDNVRFHKQKSSLNWLNNHHGSSPLYYYFLPHVDNDHIIPRLKGGATGTVHDGTIEYKPSIAGICYLNTPDECSGGTAFYKYKITNTERIDYKETHEAIQWQSKLKYMAKGGMAGGLDQSEYEYFGFPEYWFNLKGDELWECIGKVNMKFNRYIMYPENQFHSPFMEKDDFLDYYRIVQTTFS